MVRPVALRDAGITTMDGILRSCVEEVTMSGADIRISAVPAVAEA